MNSRLFYNCIYFLTALCVGLFSTPALAAAGDVLTGEYVLIINTDLSKAKESDYFEDMPQSSGTIVFDPGASPSSSALSLQTAQAEASAVDSSGAMDAMPLMGAVSYALGQTKAIGSYSPKNYTLMGIGAHCLIWLDDTLKIGYENAGEDVYTIGSAAAAVYDTVSYPVIDQFDASNYFYYADGSGKLSILLESGSVSGQFVDSDTYQANGGVTAIHINASKLPTSFDGFGALFAHEAQHAISYSMKRKHNNAQFMQLWLNEGLSLAAMDACTKGHDENGWLNGIVQNSECLRSGGRFMYDVYTDYTEINYSVPFLFLRYLNTQAYGGYDPLSGFYSKFYDVPTASMSSMYGSWLQYGATRVEYVTRQYASLSGFDFTELLANFYIAMQIQANEGVYGFYGDPIIARKISGFPIYHGASGVPVDIEKCGAIMVKTQNGSFTVPADAGADIRFIAFSPSQYQKGLQTAGTEADPHLISNAEQLSYIWDTQYRSDVFQVTADFTADPAYYTFWTDNYYNDRMDAAQRHAPDFYGTLKGGGHTISGMKQPLSKYNYGRISNLTLNCDLTQTTDLTGAFACRNNGVIEGCAVHGSISIPKSGSAQLNNFYAWIGGIAGDMRDAEENAAYPVLIDRCMSDVTIQGELDQYNNYYIGGLVGASYRSANTDLQNCYSAATLDLSVDRLFPRAVVLGGLIGDDSGALTKNCYSVADVRFTNNYTGGSPGTLRAGRLFGSADYTGNCESLYALSGMSACGAYGSEGISSLSAAQMQTAASFSGFDFQKVWQVDASSAYPYPRLRENIGLSGDVNGDGLVSLPDAILICRHIANMETLPPAKATLADLSGDGKVSVDDVLLLCRHLAGFSATPAV